MSFLNLEIGTDQKALEIVRVEKETVQLTSGPADKLILTAQAIDGKEFRISEAWVKDSRASEKVTGLWISLDPDGNINSKSTLAKLLKYHNISTPAELIGLKVIGYPDPKDFTILTTYDKNSSS